MRYDTFTFKITFEVDDDCTYSSIDTDIIANLENMGFKVAREPFAKEEVFHAFAPVRLKKQPIK